MKTGKERTKRERKRSSGGGDRRKESRNDVAEREKGGVRT